MFITLCRILKVILNFIVFIVIVIFYIFFISLKSFNLTKISFKDNYCFKILCVFYFISEMLDKSNACSLSFLTFIDAMSWLCANQQS